MQKCMKNIRITRLRLSSIGSSLSRQHENGSQLAVEDESKVHKAEMVKEPLSMTADKQELLVSSRPFSHLSSSTQQDCPRSRMSVNGNNMAVHSSGGGTISRKRKVGDSIKCNVNVPARKLSKGKATVKPLQSLHKGTVPQAPMWPEHNQEPGDKRTTQLESNFSSPAPFISHQGVSLEQRSEKYSRCDCSLKNAKLHAFQRGTQSKWRSFSCAQCDWTLRQKSSFSLHQGKHLEERPFQCTKCDKSFSRKFNLSVHQRTHTGERPYECAQCGKSFSRRFTLCVHQRTHAVERS